MLLSSKVEPFNRSMRVRRHSIEAPYPTYPPYQTYQTYPTHPP